MTQKMLMIINDVEPHEYNKHGRIIIKITNVNLQSFNAKVKVKQTKCIHMLFDYPHYILHASTIRKQQRVSMYPEIVGVLAGSPEAWPPKSLVH